MNKLHKYLLLLFIPFISLFALHAHAGTDLLKETTDNLSATVQGSGVKMLYLAEMIFCTYIYIKTRNPLVFGGVVILALGINVILRFAGLTTTVITA